MKKFRNHDISSYFKVKESTSENTNITSSNLKCSNTLEKTKDSSSNVICDNVVTPNIHSKQATSLKLSNELECDKDFDCGPSKKRTKLMKNVESNESLEKQNIPSAEFKFPRNEDGRCCHYEWFKQYPWMHYVEDKDHILCFVCMEAYRYGNKILSRGNDDVFISVGFSNWKKGIEKLKRHAASQCHRDSLEFIQQIKSKNSIDHLLQATLRQEQQDSRTSLYIIISSIRYLARSGQALRGHNSDEGNLRFLLEERSLDSPELRNWLKRRDEWCSGEIQNEIIEIMAHKLMRTLVEDIKLSPFFSIMADGTTDITGNEQFSTCLRVVNLKTFEPKEVFLGLYSLPDSKADTLYNTLMDLLIRLNMNSNDLRGHCFDGARNMAGHLNGVQAKITAEQPKSMFVHCSNHSLDLVIQEVAKQCDMIADSLILIKDVSNIILESSKRKNIYADIVLPPCTNETYSQLLPLCPTRWCVRVQSMKRFYSNYARVMETIENILNDQSCALSSDRRAVLRGYLSKMSSFETLLGLDLAILVLQPAELLAKALQSENYTASGAKQAAQCLWTTYDNMGEQDFEQAWYNCEKRSKESLDLKMPKTPRIRQRPKRFQEGSAPAQIDAKTSIRQKYVSVLDWTKNELKQRFDQPGMNQLVELEKILLNPPSSQEHLKEMLGVHEDDFKIDTLNAELKLLPCVIEKSLNIKQFATKFASLPDDCRRMLCEVQKLLILILTVPATSTSCERSFSALRRVLTHLRSNMTQKRLTHLLILHIHREKTKELILDDILAEFVSRTQERRKIFGF